MNIAYISPLYSNIFSYFLFLQIENKKKCLNKKKKYKQEGKNEGILLMKMKE